MTEESSRTPPVVVGVSGRSKSPTALRWAADAARLRGADLVAVRAWRPSAPKAPGSRGTPHRMAADRAAERAAARQTLEADVRAVLDEGEPVTVRLVKGTKRRVLLDAAADAALLVIDAPRRLDAEAAPGFLHRLLSELRCPLVVVPRAISGAPPGRVGEAARGVGRAVVESAGRAPRPGAGRLRPDTVTEGRSRKG